MASSAPLTLHARCRVANIGYGEILFVGQTSFAPGTWVGVHLDEPRGKNDGSVQGKRYFACEPRCGVFVRPSQVHVQANELEDMPRPNATPHSTRRSVGTSRFSMVAETPQTSRRATAALGPGSTGRTSGARPRPSHFRTPAVINRTPVPASLTPGSIYRTPGTSSRTPAPASQTPGAGNRSPFLSPSERAKTRIEAGRARRLVTGPSPWMGPASQDSDTRQLTSPLGETRSTKPITFQQSPTLSPSPLKEHMTRDTEQKARLEELQTECSAHVARIAALESDASRLSELTQAYDKAKARVRELEGACDELKDNMQELTDSLEMATLDREMAEERSEALQQELKTAQETVEELRLEREIHAESASAALPADAAVLLSENARLKEALIRLRDTAHEADVKQRRELSSLRAELVTKEEIFAEHTKTLEQLARLETLVSELRAQTEVAQSTEDMLETLTERNGALEELVEKLTTDLRELEALQAVSEELEATHIETEAQLQRDLDMRDEHINALQREQVSTQAHLTAHAATIEQFRALVTDLARERDTWRAKCDAPPAPAPRAPLTIEQVQTHRPVFAHDRLVAECAITRRQVQMLRAYALPSFSDVDQGAILTILLYERIGMQSEHIRSALTWSEEGTASWQPRVHDDAQLRVCRLRRAVAHVGALAKQISAVLCSSSPDVFVSRASDHVHMAHLSHQLQAHMEALEDDRLDDATCEAQCKDIVAQLEAVSQALPPCTSLHDLAAKEVGSALLAWHDVETMQACMAFVQHAKVDSSACATWSAVATRARVACRRLYRRLSSLYEQQRQTIQSDSITMLPEVSRLASAMVPRVMPWAYAVLEQRDTSALDAVSTLANDTRTLADLADTVLAKASAQEHVVDIPEAAPWKARAKTLLIACRPVDKSETEALSQRISALEHMLAERDDTVQAASIKIERLRNQLDRSHALAAEVTDARQQVEELKAKLNEAAPTTLNHTRDSSKFSASAPITEDAGAPTNAPSARAFQKLRADHQYLKAQTWLEQIAALAPLATPRNKSPTLRSSTWHEPSLDALWHRVRELATSPRVVDLGTCKSASVQLSAQRQERQAAAEALAQLHACTMVK